MLEKVFHFDVCVALGTVCLLLCGPTAWGTLGPISFVGFKTDGIIPFLAGLACAVLIGLQFHSGRVTKGNSTAALVLGAAGGIVGVFGLFRVILVGVGADHPFARAMALAVSPGLGIYLAILGGVAVVVGNLSLLLGHKHEWTEFFLRKLKKQ